MNFAVFLHNISNKIVIQNGGAFAYPAHFQTMYLRSFPNPKNNIQRSYFQYKCQMKLYRNQIIPCIINILSLPVLLYYLFRKRDILTKHPCNSVFFSDGKPESIIPKDLKNSLQSLYTVSENKEYFGRQDFEFFVGIVKLYPFSWHFLLKVLINIRRYSYYINSSNPKQIIACKEYSFASSVLTEYCHRNHVSHINVMHGEKLYFIRDSFFKFDKCYVWDDYYKSLFSVLRADPRQFVVSTPESLVFSEKNIAKEMDYTYYLGAETGIVLKKIISHLQILQAQGAKVAIRPHPRYTNQKELLKFANMIEIENNELVSIENSLLRTRNAISLYSSVLNQAIHNGINVIVDDLSNPDDYRKLKEYKYIIISEKHDLLSTVISKKEKK